MPFAQQQPRLFNQFNIEAIRGTPMGVYGIYRQGQWIYVGSGDIRTRLLAHLNGDNSCITNQRPTHYVDEVTPQYIAREKELILELTPICNKKVG